MEKKVLFALAVFSLVSTALAGPWYSALGTFKVPNPSFLTLMNLGQSANSPLSLIISSFNAYPFTQDYVFSVLDAASITAQNISDTKPMTLVSNIVWPNEVELVDASVLGKRMLAIPGGFLIPWKSTGGIWLVDISEFDSTNKTQPALVPIKITQDKSGYFYHRVRFYDVNGDGLQDIITSRAEKGVLDSGSGELLWLEQPAAGPLSGVWKSHTIAKGADFFFQMQDLDNDGVPEIVTTQYFGQKIEVFFTTSGKWSDPSSISSVVIDNTLGNMFDGQFADLDGNGVMELLVTNHVNNARLSGLYAYEVPTSNWKQTKWTRHTLYSGIPTRNSGQGQASPGEAIVFYPYDKPTSKNQMPHIILSGDGSQECYLLMPLSPWTYNVSVLVNVGGTVGTPAVGDVDNDGYAEVFVSAYDSSLIYAFTFAPNAEATQEHLAQHGRGFVPLRKNPKPHKPGNLAH